VRAFAVEWVRQAARDGIVSVLKHCPGHGSTEVDTHAARPTVRKPRAELERTDFAVFRDAIRALARELPPGQFWVMMGHIVFADIDPENPASQSERIIRIVRDDFGFAGTIVTDCIRMNALGGELWERAVAALRAGCDYVLCLTADLPQKRMISQKVAEYLRAQKEVEAA
jgi:beta-N-acetylhexosaminidase